jgi:lysophospholipase L1-like esterase
VRPKQILFLLAWLSAIRVLDGLAGIIFLNMKRLSIFAAIAGLCAVASALANPPDEGALAGWRGYATPPAGAKIKVACVGDSITQGAGATSQATASYPAFLQTLLGPGYEVRNFGQGGATLQDLEPARSYMKRGAFGASTNFEADILLLMLGTNDANTNYPATFSQLDRFTNAYDTLISHYTRGRVAKPRIFIATVAWEAAADACKYGLVYAKDWGFIQSIIQNRMAPMIRDYARARGYPLVEVNSLTMGHSEWYASDPVHPGDAGYREIAKLFFMRIQEEMPNGLPTVENTRLTALEPDGATMAGRLRSAGGAPAQAWLFWGPKDGRTTKGDWEHAAALGVRQAGPLASALAGLQAGTTYYYRYYVSNALGSTWAPLTTSFATPQAGGFAFNPSGWQKKARITFDGYHGVGLGDFPVLIKLNATNVGGFAYGQCQRGGADLRFSDAEKGGNELFYEIEKWDETAGTATSFIWVRVRSLLPGSSIWMWWGNPKASAPEAAFAPSTWAPAYQAVWHLSDKSKDSTRHGRLLAVAQGRRSPETVHGAAGEAQRFHAETELECADIGTGAAGPYAIMAWVQNAPGQTYQDWGASVWRFAGSAHGLDITTAGHYRMNWFNDLGAVESDLPVQAEGYHCLLSTVTRGGTTATLFDDGAATFPVRSCAGQRLDGVFRLGYTSYRAHWVGCIDEVRVMSTAVSSDYATAAFDTLAHNVRRAGQGFTTYGAAR